MYLVSLERVSNPFKLMTFEYFLILAIIATLSVVQSLFGMGILIFGTPTLLLLGYDFITTIGYLLPASFVISLLQVLTAKSGQSPVSRYLYLLCLPGIGVGLLLADTDPLTSWVNGLIGVILLLSALVRFWVPSRELTTAFLNRHFPTYHIAMGLTHGLTNLGGALLAVLASGVSTDKEAIRSTVAHYYLAFSATQIIFLASVMGRFDALVTSSPMAVTSALVYLLIGRRIFSLTSNPFYNTALTTFIAAYGAVILMRL